MKYRDVNTNFHTQNQLAFYKTSSHLLWELYKWIVFLIIFECKSSWLAKGSLFLIKLGMAKFINWDKNKFSSDEMLGWTLSPQGQLKHMLSWRWGQIKRPEVAPFSYVNAPFVDAGAVLTANTAPHAVIPHFSILISLFTHEIGSPLARTIESTLHFSTLALQSTFVASSKMLILSNQETVCCLLITSDCTAHYASEVNYQQNEGKIGPRL